MRKERVMAVVAVTMALASSVGCKGDGKAACTYKGDGYCFSPPPNPRVEGKGDTRFFHRGDNYIVVNTFPPQTKAESDSSYALVKKGEKVLGDAVIDDGKGWYLAIEQKTYVQVQARTTGKKYSVGCVVSVPLKDRSTSKDLIEACKTLRAID